MGWIESVARLLVKRTVAAAELENAMNVMFQRTGLKTVEQAFEQIELEE
ncbi:MAG: hypothetical protein HWQ23_15425 [Nostoc sp. JL33]|nr:hypothetical protein [Nostoc sp. JL33]MBN3871612.1 hypothetical protein [Nostoc sp. JL33]